MLRLAGTYLATVILFVALDFGWLSFASSRLYRPVLGDLLAPRLDPVPGAVFYLLYAAAILFLAVWPALKDGGWTRAALAGAVLGLAAYGTYDLTNQATLRSWALKLTVADMGWGLFATAVTATAAFHLARMLKVTP